MLHIGNEKVSLCDGHGSTRRSFLQAGSAGMVGLSLPAWMVLEASGAVDQAQQKIRNGITIFLVGSPVPLNL